MADRNIKKETKKPKKSKKTSDSLSSFTTKAPIVQPTLIKKERKPK